MVMKSLRMLWMPARLLVLLLVLFVGWQIWVFSRPLPRSYTERERAALEAAIASAFKPVAAKIGETPSRFGVAHFMRDSNDEVTRMVKRVIEAHEKWTLIESSPIQQFLADISRVILNATSVDEVVHAGRRVDIDLIVAGDVVRVDDSGNQATAAVRVNVYDARTGEWLIAGVYENTWLPGPMARLSHRMRGTSRTFRLLLWLGFVGVLPWATAVATHRTVEKKSNTAAFALLSIYVLLGMALALAFWNFNVDGLFGALKLLLALAICGGYSYWACERIAARG